MKQASSNKSSLEIKDDSIDLKLFRYSLSKAPQSSDSVKVVKWDLNKDKFDIDGYSERNLSNEDVLFACKALNSIKGYESPIYNNLGYCRYLFMIAIFAFLIGIAAVMILYGDPIRLGGYIVAGIAVIFCAFTLIYFIFIKKGYLEEREQFFKECCVALNKSFYKSRNITLKIGRLAAWLEFHINNEEKVISQSSKILAQTTISNTGSITPKKIPSGIIDEKTAETHIALNHIVTHIDEPRLLRVPENYQPQIQPGYVVAKNNPHVSIRQIESVIPSSNFGIDIEKPITPTSPLGAPILLRPRKMEKDFSFNTKAQLANPPRLRPDIAPSFQQSPPVYKRKDGLSGPVLKSRTNYL